MQPTARVEKYIGRYARFLVNEIELQKTDLDFSACAVSFSQFLCAPLCMAKNSF